MTRLIVAAVAAWLFAVCPRLAVAEEPPLVAAGSTDLVVWNSDVLARWTIRAEADGRPIDRAWSEVFAGLFAFADRTGDGSLDRPELARLPSAFGLRQILWGAWVPVSPGGPPWADADRDADGKVTAAELADHYRRAGLGGITVGFGRPPATGALTDTILKHLDADGDGAVSEAEWRTAAVALAKLDRNDDELARPGELIPGLAYPAVYSAEFVSPVSLDMPPQASAIPLLVLPDRAAGNHWSTALVGRWDRDGDRHLSRAEAGLSGSAFARLDADHDGLVTPAELATWRDRAPDAFWVAHVTDCVVLVDETPESRPRLPQDANADAARGRCWVAVRADQGQLPAQWRAGRKRLRTSFDDADADRSGSVDPAETAKPSAAAMAAILRVADRNDDGRLGSGEFEAWLDLQASIVKAQVLVSVLDHGSGLFEFLDADRDGCLSVRELRGAWERLKADGCVTDGRFDRGRLPRQFRLTISRGRPLSPLGLVQTAGPAWHRAMDRNGDGDVSRKEFAGPPGVFDRLDADRDGLLDVAEARRAKPE